MSIQRIKRALRVVGPILALIALLLVSLAFMSAAIREPNRFGSAFTILGIVNVIALLPLGALIAWNLLGLVRQKRNRVPGARLTLRMVAMFVFLSITPVLIVYFFSLTFLHRGIDSWFEVRIEEALENSLALSRAALDMRKLEILKQTESIAYDLVDVPEQLIEHRLEDARRLSGASELTLMTSQGQVLASSSVDSIAIVSNRPEESVLLQVRNSGLSISLDPIVNGGLHVRVVLRLSDIAPATESRLLQALFPFTQRVNALTASVQEEADWFEDRASSRQELKSSFTLTLSLVLLLSLCTAVLAAFVSARRAIAPLQALLKGTQAVAGGNYEMQLPRSGSGEIALLVKSFNDMIRRIAQARKDAWATGQQLEAQRRYLETVLAQLSSGVITLDYTHCLSTTNQTAGQILGVKLDSVLGGKLSDLGKAYPHIIPFTETVSARLASGEDWQEEINIFTTGGQRVLLCRGTALVFDGAKAVPRTPLFPPQNYAASPGAGDPGSSMGTLSSSHPLPGHVIVFDDLTTLIKAQRNAAWSEVARRLAHEIKNPLTPIQLSAERLRHKYLARMSPEQAKPLDDLTRTIVQQVASMKNMADDFSDYARPANIRPRLLDINGLIQDVLELYRGHGTDAVIHMQLGQGLPRIHADPDRLRQVLHNLTKNALEASRASGESALMVETICTGDEACHHIDVRFKDRGGGFPPDIIQHAFDPYLTTKPKGNGLGLAIVKKIVEEHGGMVWAENNPDGGASVIIRFPVSLNPEAAQNLPSGSANHIP